VLRLAMVVALGAGCGEGGCRRPGEGFDGALALVPDEAAFALGLDFERLRATALWRDLPPPPVEEARLLATLREETGFDPMRDVRRLVLAFPEEARMSRAFAVIIEGEHLDGERLLRWARSRAGARGATIEPETIGSRTIWRARGGGVPEIGAFLDGRSRLVLAAGAWIGRMAGPDAVRTAARDGGGAPWSASPSVLRQGRVIWGAARIPAATRTALLADRAGLGAMASIERVAFGLEMGTTLAAEVALDLGSAGDVAATMRATSDRLAAARSDPRVALLGLRPLVEAVSLDQRGQRITATLRLSRTESTQIVDRLLALIRMGSAMGKGIAPVQSPGPEKSR
jgi:hypothetical protein